MFYIDVNTQRIQKAKEEHYLNCRYVVKKRLLGSAFTEECPPLQKVSINKVNVDRQVFNYLNNEDNLRLILTGLPEELDKIKGKFVKQKNELVKILNYEYFNAKGKYDKRKPETEVADRYNSYHLTSSLGFNTCVYCNRNYINTITSGIRLGKFKNLRVPRKFLIARPTLDHWFPKSKYPILAISFFNLIPTCNICNSSIKGASILTLDKHFHPYHRNLDTDRQLDYRFNYMLDTSEKPRLIIDAKNNFSIKAIEEYSIEKLYTSHEDELQRLFKLKKHFGNSYLRNLHTILEDTDISGIEMQKLIFGNITSAEEALKHPLSKFRSDILRKLGIL